MKKTNRQDKKLTLNRSTLRSLTQRDLARATGGGDVDVASKNYASCTSGPCP